jgi:Concanavalin A-like lectin/glucanases superfamily
MSTSLILLIPVILLGIVGMFCFVGCILDTSGLPATPFSAYTNSTVGNMLCIGYWPLKEKKDTDPAAELISGNTGNYIDLNTRPDLYPWPSYNVPNGANPDVLSAAGADMIADMIKLGQPTILSGDTDLPVGTGDTVPPGCMVVNGAYVEVLWNDKFIPKQSFTVEAWVRPDWSISDPKADRFVLDVRDHNPGTGFALYAQADLNQPGVYHWVGLMGNGGAGTDGFTIVTADEIMLGSGGTPAGVVYLAMIYDAPNNTLTLFVNGGVDGVGVQVTAVPTYIPTTTQPLWIGAGAPYVDRRPQPDGTLGSPLFPFVGAIQDVAIWRDALKVADIQTRLRNGNGTT